MTRRCCTATSSRTTCSSRARGSSRSATSATRSRCRHGTPYFHVSPLSFYVSPPFTCHLPPQAWNDQEGDACYLSRDLLQSLPSTAADIFSFGIMLYEIKSGEALPGAPPSLYGNLWPISSRLVSCCTRLSPARPSQARHLPNMATTSLIGGSSSTSFIITHNYIHHHP